MAPPDDSWSAGVAAGALADPRVVAADDLARHLLSPTAAHSDEHGVPRAHLDRLGEAGLLGLAGPAPHGAPDPVRRLVTEHLAGGCGSTWFCWTQHHGPLAAVAASPDEGLRARWLEPLATGRALAGVAFAHVRRPGPPAVTASRSPDGWVLDGTLDWVTSWSICDVVLVLAQGTGEHEASLVRVLLEPHEGRGVSSGPPLHLAAMGGTWTCPVRLSGAPVPDEDVVDVVDRATWLAADALQRANASPHTFGLLRAVSRELAHTGEQRGMPAAVALAGELAEQARTLRREAYSLVDEVPADQELGRREELRAASLELAVRASSALVAARAGGAMRLGDPAQRWAREALFQQVQAQTAAGRAAAIAHYRAVGEAAAALVSRP